MTKTINCAECGVEVTYQEKEGFPRKYCFNCSAAKKSAFKHASESRPTHTPEGEPLNGDNEVVKGTRPMPMVEIVRDRKGVLQELKPLKDNGFEAHLSIENVRSNALASAIKYLEGDSGASLDHIAKKFEKYILTGE